MSAHTTPVLASLAARYAEAHERLYGPACRPVSKARIRLAPPPPAPPPKALKPAKATPPVRQWLFIASKPASVSARQIIATVATESGISMREILEPGRTHRVLAARHVACWLIRRHTRLSFPRIGTIMGGRDHTTILHAVARVERDWERLGPLAERVRARLGLGRADHDLSPV